MPTEKRACDQNCSWNVGDLPFFFRHLETPTNAKYGLPDRLAFSLEVERKTGLIRQTPNKDVETALECAYLQGSTLSGAMDAFGIGQSYALDFLAFIKLMVPAIEGKRILEIGSGTGYLLSLLRDRGADVIGIEPGPQGENAEKRFGVNVVRDFFPSGLISGAFDVVIAYAVLEHLPNPGEFLREVKKVLAPQGMVILAVPNCGPYLHTGDLSCLLHEHWSYFTNQSIKVVAKQQGFSVKIADSGFGGSLYCSARLSKGEDEIARCTDNIELLIEYRAKAVQMLNQLDCLLREAKESRESLGIYVPGRLLNALSLIGVDDDVTQLRLFDDNEALHGRYFPGLLSPVENWADFLHHPTDIVLIASNTFGRKICERIEKISKSRVIGWNDLFKSEAG